MSIPIELPLPVAADHPAFAGHFPGRPILPGALLLDWVVQAIESQAGGRVVAVPAVKFLRPLGPGAAPILSLSQGAQDIRFAVTLDGVVVASGSARLAAS